MRQGIGQLGTRSVALGECWLIQCLLAYDAMAVASLATTHLADWWLGAPERWLGFDYHTYQHGAGWAVLCAVYNSWGLAVLILATADPETLRRVTAGFARAGVIGIIASLLIPAAGNGVHGDWAAWSMMIHSGAQVEVPYFIAGVFCPSFHAVGATLVLMASRYRWPVAAWWAVLMVSCVMVGEHYILDVVAGVSLACWARR